MGIVGSVENYTLDKFAKARVWWNRDPFDGSSCADSVAVEVLIPRGPFAEYALLGATLVGGATGVRVHCAEKTLVWRESLAAAFDTVTMGLPSEYRDAVQQAAEAAIAKKRLNARVTFVHAAHGALGSNVALFGRMATGVISLLTQLGESRREDETRRVLDSIRAT